MSASQDRLESRQAPRALVTAVEPYDADRLRVEVIVVNCAPYPMAITRVRVCNDAGEVPAEIDYPDHVETHEFIGMRFTRREPVRSVRDQVMLVIRVPRAALPARVEVRTTTGQTQIPVTDGAAAPAG